MIHHHEEENLLSAYMDNELTSMERAALDAHLAVCGNCRAQLEELRSVKSTLSHSLRRAMPPELIADLEKQLFRPSWTERLRSVLALPRVGLPAGALATVTLGLAIWAGLRAYRSEAPIPLEPLLAAHEHYQATRSMPQTHLLASNFSAQLALYHDNQD